MGKLSESLTFLPEGAVTMDVDTNSGNTEADLKLLNADI